MELAAQAHKQKKEFIEKLLSHGKTGPAGAAHHGSRRRALSADAPGDLPDGHGGSERNGKAHIGQELHETPEAMKFGLKVIAHMNLMTERLAEKYGMRFVLEQTPAESTAYRFAKLDLKNFPEQATRHGSGKSGRRRSLLHQLHPVQRGRAP